MMGRVGEEEGRDAQSEGSNVSITCRSCRSSSLERLESEEAAVAPADLTVTEGSLLGGRKSGFWSILDCVEVLGQGIRSQGCRQGAQVQPHHQAGGRGRDKADARCGDGWSRPAWSGRRGQVTELLPPRWPPLPGAAAART